MCHTLISHLCVEIRTLVREMRVRRFYPSNTGINIDNAPAFQIFFKSLIKLSANTLTMSLAGNVNARLNTMTICTSRLESTGICIAKNLPILLSHEIRIIGKSILYSICKLLNRRNCIFKRNCCILHIWRIDCEKFLCICHSCCTDCYHNKKRSASPPALPRREGAGR